jgi:hypothetical protein
MKRHSRIEGQRKGAKSKTRLLLRMSKYHEACESKGGSFTPFVMSADGVLAPQATKFLETLAKRLT